MKLLDYSHYLHSSLEKPKRHFYFDLDGTLAAIVRDPEKIEIKPKVLEALSKLAAKQATLVVIISGRELQFLRKHFTDRKIQLIGSHGSEISYAPPAIDMVFLDQAANAIHAKVREYKHRLLSIPGALLEEKKYGVALHYRMSEAAGKKQVRAYAREIAAQVPGATVTIFRGKQVAEINPKIGWNKGMAIENIREYFQVEPENVFESYIGDDISDERAFKVINQAGQYSIRVRAKKTSLARYYVKNQVAVEDFLEFLDKNL